ncbi:MAG: alpha/beta hydrolase [Pirellulaceae bacterium]|nr:alpha/beta hydrolase [Planctomycetales bacterium]
MGPIQGWRRFWRSGILIIRFVLFLYAATVILAMLFEEYLIFPAPRPQDGYDNPLGLRFEDVTFDAADGTRLHGWYFRDPQARGHILYCHGNAICVPQLAEFADWLRARTGYSVLVFDYRGYGRSQGRPREAGVMTDGRAARQWLCDREGIAGRDIVLMGRSIGGAVAVDLSTDVPHRGLVLEATFSSLPEVAAVHFPVLPAQWLMRTRMNSAEKISRFQGRLLQMHGTADEVVPLALGQRLHAAATCKKQWVILEGVGHNEHWPEEYYVQLDALLDELSSHKPAAGSDATSHGMVPLPTN